MTIHPARPLFGVGDAILYTDKQGRLQTGDVQRIDASWTKAGAVPLIVYRVAHPTARNGYLYITSKDFR